jgi:hypothetical protein
VIAIAILLPKDHSYSLLSEKLTGTIASQFIYNI